MLFAFAPNPFGYTVTLATCKPMIRGVKHEGQWIAGFTLVALTGDRVGEERLIYLMRIGEKRHLRDYFKAGQSDRPLISKFATDTSL